VCKRSQRRLRIAATFFSLAILVAAGSTATAAEPVRHVVLVSVDGLSATYLDDSRAELPTLRALQKRGASAQGMITSFPSVTWPSHVSLVTGTHPATHGVIGNRVYNRKTRESVVYIGDPTLTKGEAIQVPTLYDAAHAAGWKTASVIWPCSNGAATLDWIIPDSNKAELHARYTTAGFAEELAAHNIDISPLGKWGWQKEFSQRRDELYTDVACYLLREKQVNLLLLHLITPDNVEHQYGPNTPEAYAAVAHSDACLKRIWNALQAPPLAGSSALFVVSDHGFAPYDKLIQPNVVLRQMQLIDTDAAGKPAVQRAWCVSHGGSASVYLFDDAALKAREKIVEALKTLEGVEDVLEAADFQPLGLPDPAENPQMSQLVLTTGPGYSFGESLDGDPVASAGKALGTHGHRPEPRYMHATFLAAGAGVKPGARLESVNNVDVAPTIARLMGFSLRTAEGRPLAEFLVD